MVPSFVITFLFQYNYYSCGTIIKWPRSTTKIPCKIQLFKTSITFLKTLVYGSSSLHHLHQYLGGNDGFKTPPNRYHPHYSHEYSGSHHHPPSSYAETFLNYGRLSSHDAPAESRSQELPRIAYSQETEGINRERETSSIVYESVQRTQLPATPALSQPTLLDVTTTSSKIEQTSYACLGVRSCVCWISQLRRKSRIIGRKDLYQRI